MATNPAAQKVIDVAFKELGYTEKASNSDLDDKFLNSGTGNWTKFARDLDAIAFYNGPKNGHAWCDVFVDWCFYAAFGKEYAQELLCHGDCGAVVSCSSGYFKEKGQFYDSNPRPGDQIFLLNKEGIQNHTGLVYKVDATTVYTIEGNTSTYNVATRSYSLTNKAKIHGYGRPNWSIVAHLVHSIHVEKELPTHDNWSPMFSSNTKITDNKVGSHKMIHDRRGGIMTKYTHTLFNGDSRHDSSVYAGHSPIGLSNSVTLGEVLGKEAVQSIYLTKISDTETVPITGDIRSAKGEQADIDIAKYIFNYLINEGWSSNAIYALLGNMRCESGLNPARWEEDVNWYKYDRNGDMKLDEDVPGSNGVRIDYYDGKSQMVKGYTYTRGAGLIAWTNWPKYWNWLNDASGINPFENELHAYDIDWQLKRIAGVNYDWYIRTGESYISYITSSSYYSDSDTPNYVNAKNSGKSMYLFPLSKQEFITSDLDLATLTLVFAINAEGPGYQYLKPDWRISAALYYKEKIGVESSPVGFSIALGDKVLRRKTGTGINPYSSLLNSGSDLSLPGNNAYCWAQAYNILSVVNKSNGLYSVTGSNISQLDALCSSPNEDWYEFNKSNAIFEHGKVPRLGSIICWKNLKYSEHGIAEKTRVAIVTEVHGTDAISITEFEHNPSDNYRNWKYTNANKTEHAFSYLKTSIIYNENNNWGMDKNRYEFEGFIYLFPINMISSSITIEPDNSVTLTSASPNNNNCSMLFGISDMKNIYTADIIFDMKVTPPTYKNSTTANLAAIGKNCGIHFYLTQQAVNCPNHDDAWPGTYFPRHTKDSGSTDKEPEYDYSYPFPYGVLLLHAQPANSIISNTYRRLANGVTYYEKKDVRIRLTLNDTSPEHLDAFGKDDVTKYFSRELQSYIGVSTYIDGKNMDKEDEMQISATIRKIVLYR